MNLSLVIVSWNTAAILADCLRSIQTGTIGLDYEIIVIDNASTDGSAEMVARRFPEVRLICNDTNVGFGKANNQGIRASAGSYILFLNSDTNVHSGALAALVRHMEEHSRAGACGPRLARPDGQTQAFAFGGDPTPSYLFRRGARHLLFHRALHDWETEQVQTVDWASGACLLVRRGAMEQVGGFDEKFFMYFEDNDLCLRLRKHGWKIYFNPEVSITHIGGASLAQSSIRTQWYDASLRYFYAKHYTPPARLMLEIMLPFYRRMA